MVDRVFNFVANNPFGLSNVGSYASPDLVDIDGDRDLDVFVGNVDGNTLFFRNTGNASNPIFAAPITNPFGLSAIGFWAFPVFADIDGDGIRMLLSVKEAARIFLKISARSIIQSLRRRKVIHLA